MEEETCLKKRMRLRKERQTPLPCYLEATKSERNFLEAYEERKQYERSLLAKIEHPSDYLKRVLYPQLIPALEKTAFAAIKKNALRDKRQIFNGIDYLAAILWNRNEKHRERHNEWKPAYFIYENKACCCQRPFYPFSWLVPQDVAAIMIQSYVRGYLIRKKPEVQEMRQFWKAIKEENWVLHIPTPVEEFIVPEQIPIEDRMF